MQITKRKLTIARITIIQDNYVKITAILTFRNIVWTETVNVRSNFLLLNGRGSYRNMSYICKTFGFYSLTFTSVYTLLFFCQHKKIRYLPVETIDVKTRMKTKYFISSYCP